MPTFEVRTVAYYEDEYTGINKARGIGQKLNIKHIAIKKAKSCTSELLNTIL